MGLGFGRAALLVTAVVACVPGVADAQSIGDVFRKANPAVVVIRAKGQDVEGRSGVLVSAMTVLRLGRVIELKGWHP